MGVNLIVVTIEDRDTYEIDGPNVAGEGEVLGRLTLDPEDCVVYPMSVQAHIMQKTGWTQQQLDIRDSSTITFPPEEDE